MPLLHIAQWPDAYCMYLETIIDMHPNLQIVYYYQQNEAATVLQTPWDILDAFCEAYQPYEILLEHYDHAKQDVSQTYCPTDLKTWVNQLPNTFKQELVQQFVSYCQHCQPSTAIQFYH